MYNFRCGLRGLIKYLFDVGIGNFTDEAFHVGMHADELTFGDNDFAAHFLQCHDFAEPGFFGQFPVLLIIP